MRLQILEHQIGRGRQPPGRSGSLGTGPHRKNNIHYIVPLLYETERCFIKKNSWILFDTLVYGSLFMHVYYYIYKLCSFVVFLHHNLNDSSWNYWLTLNKSMAQKRVNWVKAIRKSSYCYISEAPSSSISSRRSHGLFCGCTFSKLSNESLPNIYFLLSSSGRAEAKHKMSRQLCRGGMNWCLH